MCHTRFFYPYLSDIRSIRMGLRSLCNRTLRIQNTSTARWKYVPSYQNEITRKNKSFPRTKLGTAYRNWPAILAGQLAVRSTGTQY